MICSNEALHERFRSDDFGYRMQYPGVQEIRHFTRELGWDERFEVLSQGFHRGCYFEQCYSLSDLTKFVAKRSHRNPTGGVRDIDGEKLVLWIADSVGDVTLARAVYKAFASGDTLPIIVDTVRTLLTVRMNQYEEVLAEA